MNAIKSEAKQIERGPKGHFLKGKAPKSPGRPLGSVSIIGRIKKIFEEDPERFEAYVDGVLKDKMMRREITQQIDGKPIQPIAGVEGRPLQVIIDKALEHELTSSSATNSGE